MAFCLKRENLHNATFEEWRNATYANKLATAEGWLAATKWKGHLNTPSDSEELRLQAHILARGVDIAVRKANDTLMTEGRLDLTERMDSYLVAPMAALIIRESAELGERGEAERTWSQRRRSAFIKGIPKVL